jgi:hypothetical protein
MGTQKSCRRDGLAKVTLANDGYIGRGQLPIPHLFGVPIWLDLSIAMARSAHSSSYGSEQQATKESRVNPSLRIASLCAVYHG